MLLRSFFKWKVERSRWNWVRNFQECSFCVYPIMHLDWVEYPTHLRTIKAAESNLRMRPSYFRPINLHYAQIVCFVVLLWALEMIDILKSTLRGLLRLIFVKSRLEDKLEITINSWIVHFAQVFKIGNLSKLNHFWIPCS